MAAGVSVTELLALSDERARYDRRILAAWREGFAYGREVGCQEGYDERDREVAEEQAETARILHGAVSSVANPEAHVRRVLAAAESACRRDAGEHERAFVARARNTRLDQRTDVQKAAVLLYAPARRDGAA